MEVHAHTHTPRKKWTHYFWEFLMLFLAVFCGFLAENIREHRIEHQRAAEYAVLLRTDLMNDTSQLSSYIFKKDSLQKEFARISGIFEKKHDAITFSDFRNIKNNGIDLSVFLPNDATYFQMKNSGSLRYFNNILLLGKLSFYDVELKRLQDYWNTVKNLYGGFSSGYMLRYSVISERFLKDHLSEDPSRTLQSAGYNFEAWDEAGKIIRNVMEGIEGMEDFLYPNLKNEATDILELLKKEYHLK